MFQNYSQTYASQIMVLTCFIVLVGQQLGYSFLSTDVEFLIGALLNVGGIIWALYHRYTKGDVTVGGARKY